jgi:hypothetical protein
MPALVGLRLPTVVFVNFLNTKYGMLIYFWGVSNIYSILVTPQNSFLGRERLVAGTCGNRTHPGRY